MYDVGGGVTWCGAGMISTALVSIDCVCVGNGDGDGDGIGLREWWHSAACSPIRMHRYRLPFRCSAVHGTVVVCSPLQQIQCRSAVARLHWTITGSGVRS
jgi:hypothetical protein